MLLQISDYENLFYAISLILILLIILILIRAIFLKNKKTKRLNIEKTDHTSLYQKRLFELIEVDTPSFSEGEGYYKFKSIIERHFPLVHQHLKKEKLDGNAIYTYKTNTGSSPSILLASHIDYVGNHIDAYEDGTYIYGNGTFDSKSLVFVIFEAVEAILREKGKLDIDLTIVITNDDEANKDGIVKIIDLFLRRGNFFNLVVEEGSGIIDPEVYGLKSSYALIGLGVSGQVQLSFEAKEKDNLEKFIHEVSKPNFFKFKVDNKAIKVLNCISKDLQFKDRFFLNNLFLFRRKSKKIIENKYQEIEKMLKTSVNISQIKQNDAKYRVDMTFELSTHENSADILMHLDTLMTKYAIDYKIIKVTDASKITRTYTYGYNFIKNAILKVFKDLYIAPVIVTKISEKRYFDKVSDCVIRFSPLYYDYESFIAANSNKSRINCTSLDYGVNFYKYILGNYNKKGD